MFDTGGGAAEFAGGDTRKSDELSPAERGSRGGEFLRDGPVILLCVQGTVFTDRVLEEEIEDGAFGETELTVLGDDRRSLGLIVFSNRPVGIGKQFGGCCGTDLFNVLGMRMGNVGIEFSTTVTAVVGNFIAGEYQTGGSIPLIGNRGHIAQGIDGIAGMNSDGVAVDGTGRFFL